MLQDQFQPMRVTPPAGDVTCLIAMGSNQGADRIGILRAAVGAMKSRGLHVAAASRMFSTPCFPAGAGPDYVNAALRVTTALSPEAVLAELHEIEAEFGRERVQRWGMRTLDLDLLDHGGIVCPDLAGWQLWVDLPPERQRAVAPDHLVLPHPRIQDRAFVLVPLAEVAEGWRHPVTGQDVAAMLTALPEEARDEVVAIA